MVVVIILIALGLCHICKIATECEVEKREIISGIISELQNYVQLIEAQEHLKLMISIFNKCSVLSIGVLPTHKGDECICPYLYPVSLGIMLYIDSF